MAWPTAVMERTYTTASLLQIQFWAISYHNKLYEGDGMKSWPWVGWEAGRGAGRGRGRGQGRPCGFETSDDTRMACMVLLDCTLTKSTFWSLIEIALFLVGGLTEWIENIINWKLMKIQTIQVDRPAWSFLHVCLPNFVCMFVCLKYLSAQNVCLLKIGRPASGLVSLDSDGDGEKNWKDKYVRNFTKDYSTKFYKVLLLIWLFFV